MNRLDLYHLIFEYQFLTLNQETLTLISVMNISNKDLNLLVLFNTLYREQNLTLAAEKLSLSQPALSHKLNKLRAQFDDPLFVRASRGLTPTPKADALAPEISSLVGDLEQFYYQADDTNFLDKTDVIHIYSTDFVEQYLLPKLLPIVQSKAPKVQLVTHNTRGKLPQRELETGECDIAIAGFYNNLPPALFQQNLKKIGFKVLASHSNKRLKRKLSLEEYLECPHLVTTLTGDLDGLVDKALKEKGKKRNVAAGISSFVAPAASVAYSEFLLTCLDPVAQAAAEFHPDLTIYNCPVKIADAQIQQIWHQRTNKDPIRSWLRGEIKQIFAGQ